MRLIRSSLIALLLAALLGCTYTPAPGPTPPQPNPPIVVNPTPPVVDPGPGGTLQLPPYGPDARPITVDQLNSFVERQSTMAQVLTALGKPLAAIRQEDGGVALMYPLVDSSKRGFFVFWSSGILKRRSML